VIFMKKRNHLDFDEFLNDSLKEKLIKAHYDMLHPEYAVISAIINAREKHGITQKKLAEKMGTKQSVISRLESGNANPTIEFLKKAAEALDLGLEIKFKPLKKKS
jgi:ribosome-binding protein aMBF1 (putative translation factor)